MAAGTWWPRCRAPWRSSAPGAGTCMSRYRPHGGQTAAAAPMGAGGEAGGEAGGRPTRPAAVWFRSAAAAGPVGARCRQGAGTAQARRCHGHTRSRPGLTRQRHEPPRRLAGAAGAAPRHAARNTTQVTKRPRAPSAGNKLAGRRGHARVQAGQGDPARNPFGHLRGFRPIGPGHGYCLEVALSPRAAVAAWRLGGQVQTGDAIRRDHFRGVR